LRPTRVIVFKFGAAAPDSSAACAGTDTGANARTRASRSDSRTYTDAGLRSL
jgi:hypothetical protein